MSGVWNHIKGLAACAAAVAAMAGATAGAEGFCLDCLSLRVGPPRVVRGPLPDELDNQFTVVRLRDGRFRGFSANARTFAIDARSVPAMRGARRPVLAPGADGSASACGRWLNGALRAGGRLYGFIHQERGCDYRAGRTDKSMAVAVSGDEGLSWRDLGTVISGRDAPAADRITGEGDCGWVDGGDAYLYAYCLRSADWRIIAARAPVADPGPGNWRKYHAGGWSGAGLDGEATPIDAPGTAPAYLSTLGRIALIGNVPEAGGLRLALSADRIHFAYLGEPLLPADATEWDRPAESDLIAYVSVIDPRDGDNAVGADFLLAYVYVPPGEGFDRRYLVVRRIRLAREEMPPAAQVGVALVRYRHVRTGARRAGTGPVTEAGYRAERTLGYLLTRPRDGAATRRLVECAAGKGPEEASTLASGDCEDGARRLRTAGHIYASEQPGTVALFRCVASSGTDFISDRADCEGQGAAQTRLGYAMPRLAVFNRH